MSFMTDQLSVSHRISVEKKIQKFECTKALKPYQGANSKPGQTIEATNNILSHTICNKENMWLHGFWTIPIWGWKKTYTFSKDQFPTWLTTLFLEIVTGA